MAFPVMYQNWCDLTFLHWPVALESVAQMVPAPLEVDTFDGTAWVGVTPFRLSGLRPPFAPALPWISEFPETNCRTYVRGPAGSGIWFFSLDAARVAAVAGARMAYGLPYAWSEMRVDMQQQRVVYQSRREWPDREANADIEIEPGEAIEAGEREIFLTARFRLYSHIGGRLIYAEVEHAPWPLQSARVVRCEQNLVRMAGLPMAEGTPVAHFSPGVKVRVGRPRWA